MMWNESATGVASTPPSGRPEQPSIEKHVAELLERMRKGEREAAAQFVTENAELIRRRFRGRLGQPIRRLFDSQDLLSTIARRLDEIVMRRAVQASSESALWSLVNALGTYAVAEHADRALRHRSFRDPAKSSTPPLAAPSTPGAGVEDERDVPVIQHCLEVLASGADRRILLLRSVGRSHAEIAEGLGLTTAAVRKRWERIRKALGNLRCNDESLTHLNRITGSEHLPAQSRSGLRGDLDGNRSG
jgi:DNA-directed RNA polymerase specialized sigma24 family protein